MYCIGPGASGKVDGPTEARLAVRDRARDVISISCGGDLLTVDAIKCDGLVGAGGSVGIPRSGPQRAET